MRIARKTPKVWLCVDFSRPVKAQLKNLRDRSGPAPYPRIFAELSQ